MTMATSPQFPSWAQIGCYTVGDKPVCFPSPGQYSLHLFLCCIPPAPWFSCGQFQPHCYRKGKWCPFRSSTLTCPIGFGLWVHVSVTLLHTCVSCCCRATKRVRSLLFPDGGESFVSWCFGNSLYLGVLDTGYEGHAGADAIKPHKARPWYLQVCAYRLLEHWDENCMPW